MPARASITAVVSTWEVWKADTVAGVQAVKWSVVLSMSTMVATRCYGIRYRAACESVTSRPVTGRFRRSAAVPPKVREVAADRLTTENAVEMQRTFQRRARLRFNTDSVEIRGYC
jgi:hypothetical protein